MTYCKFLFSLAPSPPVIKQFTVVDSTSVYVEWNRPIQVYGILQYYTVTYVTKSDTKKLQTSYNGVEVSRQRNLLVPQLCVLIILILVAVL